MTKDTYTIVSAPSKYDLMMGVFERKPVVFRTEEGLSFTVNIFNLEVLADQEHDAWAIKGMFQESGRSDAGLHGDCFLHFSTRNRSGSFRIKTPPNEKFTMEGLQGLSSDELRIEIEGNERVARQSGKEFNEYLDTLCQHDRLMVMARASQRMVQVFLHTRLDHQVHCAVERKEGPLANAKG